MKLSAMISRQKGRDFYDAMYMLGMVKPDYNFLTAQRGIHNLEELKLATVVILKTVDLNKKMKDFEHLLFSKTNNERILAVGAFIKEMK